MGDLRFDVLTFVREVRQRPALASGDALDALEQAAQRSFDGGFVTQTSPVAPLTWMSRSLLKKDQQESQPDELKLGEPIEIVGCLPTILANDEANPLLLAPPAEAIDVFLELNRREQLTAQGEKGSAVGRDRTVVNLPMISVQGPRLFGLYLGAADPILSIRFRWAVPLSTVAAYGWADAQVSIGFYVRSLIPGRRSAVGRGA
jgi:hypothetical protein